MIRKWLLRSTISCRIFTSWSRETCISSIERASSNARKRWREMLLGWWNLKLWECRPRSMIGQGLRLKEKGRIRQISGNWSNVWRTDIGAAYREMKGKKMSGMLSSKFRLTFTSLVNFQFQKLWRRKYHKDTYSGKTCLIAFWRMFFFNQWITRIHTAISYLAEMTDSERFLSESNIASIAGDKYHVDSGKETESRFTIVFFELLILWTPMKRRLQAVTRAAAKWLSHWTTAFSQALCRIKYLTFFGILHKWLDQIKAPCVHVTCFSRYLSFLFGV